MQAELDKYIRKLESSKLHPIIFISGFRGSGKTTLAKKLVATYLNAIHFDSDWYQKYSTKERVSRVKRALDSGDNDLIDQEENPSNNYNWDLFEKDLKELQARGRLIIENARDQKTGEKNLKRVLDFEGMGGG
jgi:adenylate kinase family enzyme